MADVPPILEFDPDRTALIDPRSELAIPIERSCAPFAIGAALLARPSSRRQAASTTGRTSVAIRSAVSSSKGAATSTMKLVTPISFQATISSIIRSGVVT